MRDGSTPFLSGMVAPPQLNHYPVNVDRITKRQRELSVLEMCLSRMWGGRQTWTLLAEQERPDFLVKDPAGNTLGVEVTELLTSKQGEDRALDNRLNLAAIEVISKWMKVGPKNGAFVIGHNRAIPDRSMNLAEFREALSNHLRLHGDPAVPNLNVSFRHSWGEIQAITSWAWPEVHLSGNGWEAPLEYMSGRPKEEIESDLTLKVAQKVQKARSYDRTHPLWLIVANPNQGITRLTEKVAQSVRETLAEVYQRAVLANLPLGTRDARPPFPYWIDLL